jgi:putative oxygen-independent coproporphyrinogen III oxidase
MAGIYLHIPYCKQACHYCNFHFSTQLSSMEAMTQAMVLELEQRREGFGHRTLETIYFGGGTPSLLPLAQLETLFEALHKSFSIAPGAEITLECNPDDLKGSAYQDLVSLGVNRLSVGIQSFREQDLRWMNRAHTAQEAEEVINRALQGGFRNFSVDLIYGLPHMSTQDWLDQLNKVADLPVHHLSCYALTVEPKTALAHFVKTGQSPQPDEEEQWNHFLALRAWAPTQGFEAYEISNLARAGQYALHNTRYWTGGEYLGLGPGAHSYYQGKRWINLPNNPQYIRQINQGGFPTEIETLDEKTQFNEAIMTRLRTQWGLPLAWVEQSPYAQEFSRNAAPILEKGWLCKEDHAWKLTEEGLRWADKIASDLFVGWD